VATNHPDLVREITEAGHEIGSHGYAHRLVYEQSPSEFRKDVQQASRAIEQACGVKPVSYRAPGFSFTPRTSWAFEILVEEGFRADSSIFPARRGHGGWRAFSNSPCRIETKSGNLIEFPIPVYPFLGFQVPFSGGGYLRLLPYPFIRHFAKSLNLSGVPVTFYMHPREFDTHHPRLAMSLYRRFKSYVGIRSTRRKVRGLLADFGLTPVRNLLESIDKTDIPLVDLR
jgi:polysaccharide deacetylase family protein (PEP-CTERM system associated)